jgi:hypothetical protein
MPISPEQYDNTPALELLRLAEQGRIGFDQRLLRSLLARREETLDALEKFVAAPGPDVVADLTEQVFDLYRSFRSPRALPFYLGLLTQSQEGVPDALVEAFAELGEAALEPLLQAYEEASEDDRPDVLFVLASIGAPHPKLRELIQQAIEADPYEGALCASLCGDKELLPSLQEALARLPAGGSHKHERQAIEDAIRELEAGREREAPEPFDILAQYPEEAPPLFDFMEPVYALEYLDHPDPEYRARAAASFSDEDISDAARDRLMECARADSASAVRAAALRGLAARASDPDVLHLLQQVLRDPGRAPEERAGALVAMAGPGADEELQRLVLEAYENSQTRAAAVEAMWRMHDRRYLPQIAAALKSEDTAVALQAIQAVGVLAAEDLAIELVPFFQHEELREAALFSYALAVRHDTTPKSVRRLFEKIAERAGGLSDEEEKDVALALDIRLERGGYRRMFFPEEGDESDLEALSPEPARSAKTGRNDPCPCGSGKKYKKCCGKPE